MPLDEKQGLLNFTPAEEPEKINCQYCQDVGLCLFCERGRLVTKERKDANAGKKTKNNSFYAKRRWKFKSK